MTKPQEFTIQVQSEDPEKLSNNKPDLAGSSKLLKDAKDGKHEDGEELVRDLPYTFSHNFHHDIIVRGGPAAKGSIRNVGRAIEGLITMYLLCSTNH